MPVLPQAFADQGAVFEQLAPAVRNVVAVLALVFSVSARVLEAPAQPLVMLKLAGKRAAVRVAYRSVSLEFAPAEAAAVRQLRSEEDPMTVKLSIDKIPVVRLPVRDVREPALPVPRPAREAAHVHERRPYFQPHRIILRFASFAPTATHTTALPG